MEHIRRSFVKRVLLFVSGAAVVGILLVGCSNPVTPQNSASGSSADEITAFSIVKPAVTGDISGTKISVAAPWYVNPTSLVADFTASTGTTVTVNGTPQASGTTVNDFSKPVTYTVTAADGTTSRSYTVTVTVANLTFTDETTSTGSNSAAHGQTWGAVASSSDGTKLVAAAEFDSSGMTQGYIWTSTDGGVTWTKQTNSGTENWRDLTSSADGSVLAAGVHGGDIYVSTNSGVDWTDSTPSGAAHNNYWDSISSSSDGTHMAAVDKNSTDIWTSTDSGAKWTDQTSSGNAHGHKWYGIASNSEGTRLVAVEDGSSVGVSNGGDIWTGTYSGGSWTWTDHNGSADPTPRYWRAVASSSDGAKLVAVGNGTTSNGGDIWTSDDGGTTWTDETQSGGPNSGAHNQYWLSVASSSDGTVLVAVDGSGKSFGDVWTSVDSGKTWTDQTTSGSAPDLEWTSVAISADGSKIIAASDGSQDSVGDIWIGN